MKMIPAISIKWKLLCLCIALVTAPTVTMGIFSFNTLKEQTYRNTEKTLKIISTDWQKITRSYIDQMQRVLKREEVLVQQRLNYVAEDVNKMLEILYESHGSDPPQHEKKVLFDTIAEIKIGRSGYVSLLDIDGNYVLSRDHLMDGASLLEMDDTRSAFVSGVLNSLEKLQSGDNHVMHYGWAEEGYAEPRMRISVLSYFKPWKLIVCVNTYYTDFKSYEIERQLKNELRYKIAGQHIGENGYIWVINSEGEYVVSKDRLRDGENIIDSRDQNGVFFVKNIIANARSLVPGEVGIEHYSWRNMGEPATYDKVAAVTYVPEWDWIIGASAYHKDFLQGLGMIKSYIYRICIFAILIGSLIAYFLATLISKPVMQLKKISMQASKGDLNVHIDEKVARKQDEIGSLATSFNFMISSLKNLIEQKEATSAALIKANDELVDTNKLLQIEIAERVQAESMLEKLRRQNELILKAAGEGIYGLDLDGNTTFVNPAAADMIGWKMGELIGRNHHEVLHHSRSDGSDYPKEECPIYAALKDGAVHQGDNEVFWRKDGSRFPVEYISTPIRDEQDSIIGAVVVFRDITESKLAEEALKKSEEKYRLIVDNSPIGIYKSTVKGKFLFANKAFLKLVEFESLDDFLSEPVLNRYREPEQREILIRDLKQYGRAENIYVGAITKTGKHIDTLITATLEGETITGMILNITELKQAEEELKLSAERLKQSNSELEQFAYIASHDLKEPLRKVAAFGDRLKDKYADALEEQGRDYLERMQSAARRMQTLIDGLLTYSRVTTKAQPFVRTDLSTVVSGVLSDLEVRIEQTNGRVEVGDMPTIDADPLQMRQLMQNLIGNALKFNKEDEPPVVKVSGMFCDGNGASADNEYYKLIIEDNGIGFDAQYTDRIFGVFQRLHGRREYEGTGIGLSVCKKIVERHGGSITAKSSPGEGASFIVALPVKHGNGGPGGQEDHTSKRYEGSCGMADSASPNKSVNGVTQPGPAGT